MPFSEYVVHHKDGNKKNNDIDNLEILEQKEHEEIHGINNYPTPTYNNEDYSSPSNYSSYSNHNKTIFSNFFVLHGIALIIFWAIVLVVIFNISFDSGIFGFFAFLWGFLTGAKFWEVTLVLLMGYFLFVGWWMEMIRGV